MRQTQAEGRWYREPWPWILFGLPASAVIAGVITLVIAVKNEDGLVAQDYYKQGLSINRVLERESRAAALDLRARLWFDGDRVRVTLSGRSAMPPTLTLHLVHPTRAGEDRVVPLARMSGGEYLALAPTLAPGRWLVQIEDAEGDWRLSGRDWRTGEALVLDAAESQGQGKRP